MVSKICRQNETLHQMNGRRIEIERWSMPLEVFILDVSCTTKVDRDSNRTRKQFHHVVSPLSKQNYEQIRSHCYRPARRKRERCPVVNFLRSDFDYPQTRISNWHSQSAIEMATNRPKSLAMFISPNRSSTSKNESVKHCFRVLFSPFGKDQCLIPSEKD